MRPEGRAKPVSRWLVASGAGVLGTPDRTPSHKDAQPPRDRSTVHTGTLLLCIVRVIINWQSSFLHDGCPMWRRSAWNL